MSKKNDYLEKLKAAKAEAARIAEEANKPKGLPCGSCGVPSRGLINGICFACDEKARRDAKRGKMPEPSGRQEPAPKAEAIGGWVNVPKAAHPVQRRLYLVASNGNILI